ncbi:hypothetical protein ACMFMF_006320 [Clarireedia jacksonii]
MSIRPSSRGLTEDEHRRKRVRKGTKSCWECKRRKVKCQLSSENVSICSGCLARGTNCLSQEYPEEHDSSAGTQVGERLGRLEVMLEKVLSKMEAYEEEDNAQKIHTPESMGSGDVLTSSSSKTSNPYGNTPIAPIISLFDNPILGRRENTSQTTTTTPSGDPQKTSSCRPLTKIERIRDALVELLPTQEVTDKLCSFSDCWLLQLPHGFDTSELHFSTSVEARVDKIISTVSGLVTSDDEIVSTINGLECLTLQGLFHTNAGNLRRAWLTFRRAMNIAQLMGLHKRQNLDEHRSSQGGRHLWDSILQAERYIGLLLGMPAGTANIVIEPHETFNNPNIDHDLLFCRRLVNLAGGIMERNQNEYIHAFASTQDLDEQLENIGRAMPPSWWAVPAYLDTSDKSAAAAAQYDRTMSQIWYFQLQSFLHLPFMIRAATERRFEYSRFTCLKSSRETIYRYLVMRRSGTKSFCCKVIDFAAFTGCVTLLLALLEPPQPGSHVVEVEKQKAADRELVGTVVTSMEEYAAQSKDVMAKQSADVIKALLAVNMSTNAVANIRLTIPYFGTISIARTTPSSTTHSDQLSSSTTPIHSTNLSSTCPDSTQSHNQTPDARQLEQPWSIFNAREGNSSNIYSPPPTHPPIVSFKSSQFPPVGPEKQQIQDWGEMDADTMFFDSLLNTDLEGNWIF